MKPTYQQSPQQQFQPYQPQSNQFCNQGPQKGQSSGISSIEDTLHSFIKSVAEMKNENERKFENIHSSLRKLEVQVGQIAEGSQKHVLGKLPSHAEQAKAIHVLRSGRTVNNQVEQQPTEEEEQRNVRETVEEQSDADKGKEDHKERQKGKEKAEQADASKKSFKAVDLSQLPYPHRMMQTVKDKQYSELFKMLSRVEVNLPLLDMIQNVPTYAKFFKDLCSRKRKLNLHEKVFASDGVNSVFHCELPTKMKDLGSF